MMMAEINSFAYFQSLNGLSSPEEIKCEDKFKSLLNS